MLKWSFVSAGRRSWAILPKAIFPQDVPAPNQCISKNIPQALSPEYVDEWGPAIDKENKGFQHHNCFAAVLLPSGTHPLPGLWVFTQKRDGTSKARFCVGSHHQIMDRDYFPSKKLLYYSLKSWQSHLVGSGSCWTCSWRLHCLSDWCCSSVLPVHGKLDDVDIYINPPARYPCPAGMVLKLLKTIYGLTHAPVKFNQKVIDWFKGNGYLAANDAQTIWIKRDKMIAIIHALYADDFLHFTNNKALYQDFQK